MSTKETQRGPVLEHLLRNELTQQEAAEVLQVTTRQVRRLTKRYVEKGVAGLIHQSRGKTSNRKITDEVVDKVIGLIRDKYGDFGPTLAAEKLAELDGITLSDEFIRQTMHKAGIWHPKKRRKANVHQLRERRSNLGELVQIDGSPHAWFEDRGTICCLLVFIDDATGKLLWLEFCESESTRSYFKATKGYILRHGRPLAFYSDKHGVFRVNKAKDGMENESTGLTQFGRAIGELGITPIFANSPQAKGRVEKMNETLQDRLVKELRLRGLSTIEAGNAYLPEFIAKFNCQFAVVPTKPENLHRPLLPTHNLDQILTIQEYRVVSKNLSCQYQNIVYQIQTKRSAYTLRNKKVLFREDLNGHITLWDKTDNLPYTIIKQQPKQEVADSKRVNEIMNILVNPYHQPQTFWETPLSEMTEAIYV